MKRLLIAILLFVAGPALAQRTRVDTIGRDVPAEGRSKAQLYRLARIHIATTYPKDAIKMEDSSAGIIIVEGSLKVDAGRPMWDGYYRFQMRFEAKDDRYRYSFYNIAHSKWGDLQKPAKLIATKDDFKGMFDDAQDRIAMMAHTLEVTVDSLKKDW